MMQMAGTQLHVLERADVICFYFVFLILLVDTKFLIISYNMNRPVYLYNRFGNANRRFLTLGYHSPTPMLAIYCISLLVDLLYMESFSRIVANYIGGIKIHRL